jgi:GNAT superfamily N-acetyltransferase
MVDALLARSYPLLLAGAYAPDVLAVALPVIARVRPELLTSGSYWLAVLGNEVVGAGGWTQADPAGGAAVAGLAHVRHVVTDVDHVRRGIAGRLMQAAMAQGRTAGVVRYSCLSTLSAVPFYQSLGFAVQHPCDVTLTGGVVFPAVQMMLDCA